MLTFWDKTLGRIWRQNYYYKNINDLMCCLETHENKNIFNKTYNIKNQIFANLVYQKILVLASTENYPCEHFNHCPLGKNLEEVLNPPKSEYLRGISYCKGMRRYIFICFNINECYEEIYNIVSKFNYNSSLLPPLLITLGKVDHKMRKFMVVVEKDTIMKAFSYQSNYVEGLKDYEDLSWTNFIKK